MIRRSDPSKAGDIGELADRGVRDIGISFAVRIVAQFRSCDATAFANFYKPPERRLGYGAVVMDIGLVAQPFAHD